MSEIKELNVNQRLAIEFPTITKTELELAWKNPIVKQLDSKRNMLINLMVGPTDGIFYWHCAIRVHNKAKVLVKPVLSWMNNEKATVTREIQNQLEGLGIAESLEFFTSVNALHCTVKLNSEEIAELEKLHPLIAAKKIVPVIEDTELLDAGGEDGRGDGEITNDQGLVKS